jgi:predicted molibdopterin-dependent oxidoreductase YjgC
MFRRNYTITDPVHLKFEDKQVIAQRGDSVAAALLAAGITRFRSSVVSGQPRAPFCMIGNCFECLIKIDGEPNRQACQIEVEEGMQIHLQDALPGAKGP